MDGNGGEKLVKILGLRDMEEKAHLRQLILAMRVQQPKVGVELLTVLTRELGANAVESDVERTAVGLSRLGQQGGGGEGVCSVLLRVSLIQTTLSTALNRLIQNR